ncbi:MAG: nucleoside triphosphate pyrophosphohydrolase [Rhodospirillales bacterium]
MSRSSSSLAMDRLLAIMAALRDPQSGCPWDVEQTFATIAPYTIEEAYEVSDAIQRGDMDALKDELGDLLFQVVFYAQMSREAGGFDFEEIAQAISEKMERRHPHVFGDAEIADSEAQTRAWEEYKAAERAEKGETAAPKGALDGVALALPALMRAYKLQQRAARVGFEWENAAGALEKVHEEIEEIRAEIEENAPHDRIEDEIGDLFFALVNYARMVGVTPEDALRRANDKFLARFRRVEARLAERGKTPETSNLEEMDVLWNEVKHMVTAKKGS